MTDPDPFDRLDSEERRIADMLIAGMNTSEIAKRLSLSYHAVAETAKTIRGKLGVANLGGLRRLAGGNAN